MLADMYKVITDQIRTITFKLWSCC